ncbi:hypothetical protein EV702DRAFT_1195136 [Suillus placidus]|uniref:Uncharacterized protein n=1 Tax=Suillus placidus TaxID=48579 RepID=A0A9P7D5J3_9AGAM|nr:hypothetical protein EV702DRAFT_1195136 [Suillus placidus]
MASSQADVVDCTDNVDFYDNVIVMDIDNILAGWPTYEVKFMPQKPGPVKLVIRLKDAVKLIPVEESTDMVAFWTPSLYEAWKKSPSAQYTEHGTFPFLENTDGEPIEKSEISRIMKSLRSCWAALKQENRALNTWGKAGNKILDEVTEEMARLHPILALCENGWKVHAIATEWYPSWTATHLDKKKRKVHATGFDCNDHDSSKRQNVSGSTEPESDGSKSQITANKPTDTLSESLKVKQDTLPKDATVTPTLDLQNCSKSDVSTSELERQSNNPPQPPCIEVSTTLSLPVPCISLISADDSNESPEASSHENTANTTPQDTSSGTKAMTSFPIIKNPLAKLAERKCESTVPDPVAPSAMSALSSASTLPPSNIPAASTSATVESASGKKFRPGTSKNGRSLCAHRWLKQVTANGSSADFRIYWSSLTKDKQLLRTLAYEADALKLVSDDIWNRQYCRHHR